MSRLLFIAHRVPYPPDKGERMRAPNKVMAVGLLVLPFLASCADTSNSPGEARVTLVFRYDDCSATSSGESEDMLLQAFRRHGMPCTMGVIPHICTENVHEPRPQGTISLTPAKAEFLRQVVRSGLVEVALHGYSHQTVRPRSEGGCTEFQGVAYERQVAKILEGKRYLEHLLDTEVTTFIPPWNRYDANTLRALGEARFKCLSADRRGTAGSQTALTFLPAPCEFREIGQAVEQARHLHSYRPIIVVLLHPYDFAGPEAISPEELERTLQWVQSQDDVRVCSIRQAVEGIAGLDGENLERNKYYYLAAARLVPPFMRPGFLSNQVYLPGEASASLVIMGGAWLIAVYGSIIAVSFAGMRGLQFLLSGRSATVLRISLWLGSITLVAAVVCAASLTGREYVSIIMGSITFGVSGAALQNLLRRRRNSGSGTSASEGVQPRQSPQGF